MAGTFNSNVSTRGFITSFCVWPCAFYYDNKTNRGTSFKQVKYEW